MRNLHTLTVLFHCLLSPKDEKDKSVIDKGKFKKPKKYQVYYYEQKLLWSELQYF
jgi:hypothetical protein